VGATRGRNTLVLNEDELIEIERIFKGNNMLLLSMKEAMAFSEVSILHNKTTHLYIVKVANFIEILRYHCKTNS